VASGTIGITGSARGSRKITDTYPFDHPALLIVGDDGVYDLRRGGLFFGLLSANLAANLAR